MIPEHEQRTPSDLWDHDHGDHAHDYACDYDYDCLA